MFISLNDIYFYENMHDLEKELNHVLDSFKLDHKTDLLISHDEFIKIEDPNHNIITGLLKTVNRRTHHFVDVVNILFQYYLRMSRDHNPYRFIRDISKVLLTRTDVKNFQFCRLISSKEHPAAIFKLIKRPYYIEATDSDITDNIKMISVYSMNQTEIEDYESSLFVPIVFNKAVKSTGNIYITLLYQMMLFVHYYFSFIKGTSAWNNT